MYESLMKIYRSYMNLENGLKIFFKLNVHTNSFVHQGVSRLCYYYDTSLVGILILFLRNSWYLIFLALIAKDFVCFYFLIALGTYFILFIFCFLPRWWLRIVLSLFAFYAGPSKAVFNLIFSFCVLFFIFYKVTFLSSLFFLRLIFFIRSLILVSGFAYKSYYSVSIRLLNSGVFISEQGLLEFYHPLAPEGFVYFGDEILIPTTSKLKVTSTAGGYTQYEVIENSETVKRKKRPQL